MLTYPFINILAYTISNIVLKKNFCEDYSYYFCSDMVVNVSSHYKVSVKKTQAAQQGTN